MSDFTPDQIQLIQELAKAMQNNSGSQDLLEQVCRDYMSAKIQAHHIKNYNGANLAFNHAADIANKLGLSPSQASGITPFPCPANTFSFSNQVSPPEPQQPAPVAETQKTEEKKGGGGLISGVANAIKKVALPAAIGLATGGVGAGAAAYFLNQPAVAPVIEHVEQKASDVGFSVESN